MSSARPNARANTRPGARPGAVRAALRAPALALALAAPVAGAADADAFERGRRLFETDRFAEAVEVLERAVEARPGEAERHRWLGMAYGRLAERGTWNVVRRIRLVELTREQFERAVELDPDSVEALETLMDFYREAPGFLGGDAGKAAALERRIEALERGTGPSP